VARLVASDARLWLSRSWTTRAPRAGESSDAYRFVTEAEFEQHAAEDGFLEWAEFQDHRYGTPWPDPPAGRDVILEIEVQGAAQVKARRADSLLIVIDAPSRAEQAERLRGRGDPETKVQERLASAEDELVLARTLGAQPVINQDIDRTVNEVAALIEAHRA
jgi:guanylate kinase